MRKAVLRTAWGALVLAVGLGAAGYFYLGSLDLDSQPPADPGTTPDQLSLFDAAKPQPRGRMLVVVTSTAKAGETIGAGLELTELSRAYYTFIANGFDVEIASPRGGRPPVRMDDELIDVDHAFLNDQAAQHLLSHTLAASEVDPARYSGVYYVGGKGAMFDFRGNPAIQDITAAIYESGGVVGAVCHGPAALLDVKLSDGTNLLQGKRVTGFSNEEELFLIENAREVFPFLLEDQLAAQAADFSAGPRYLDHAIIDGRLVTGQNPWSTWSVAEGMVQALGHTPVARQATAEEKSVRVLQAFHRDGASAAAALRTRLGDADKRLLLMHAVIAVMDGRVGQAFELQALAHWRRAP